MEQKNGAATASTILGIVSLVLAIIGGITFGVIGAAIALILGIVAVVLGINAKKTDRRHKRSGWFCLWFDWYYLCCYFCSRMFNLWCC